MFARVPFAARVASLSALLLLAGCGGAFADAMQRGDQYMQAGMWDQAAGAYERANRLDPSDPRAAVQLREARRRQAGDRMARARTVADRQDFEAALRLGAEAVSLDPGNLEHQRELNLIVEQAVAQAARSAAQGEAQSALALAEQVLAVVPHHAGARSIAERVHQQLAAQRFARARSFEHNGLLGNALVELAACVDHVPAYPDARRRLSELHAALRREVTLRVGIVSDHEPDEVAFSDLVSAQVLGASFDPALAVAVTEDVAPDSNLVLSGRAVDFSFGRDRDVAVRTCEYVCGVDHEPNPDHVRAERTVAEAERRLASEEERSARLEQEVNRHQREVDEAQRFVSRAESDVDRARQDLERCRERRHHDDDASRRHGQRCRSERNRLESEQRDLERARQRLEDPRRRLERAREAWARARGQVHDARRARSDTLERMRSTPRMIEVERVCPHDYRVEQHRHHGRLTLDLQLRQAANGQPVVSFPRLQLDTRRDWETYRGQPGRCPAVGKPPPAVLPNDGELRRALEDQLVAQVAGHVREHAHRRLDAMRAAAMSAESAGRIDDAVEGYVRFVIAGGLRAQPQAAGPIDALLRRTRGVNGIRVVFPSDPP